MAINVNQIQIIKTTTAMTQILKRPEAKLRKPRPVFIVKGTVRSVTRAIEIILREHFETDIIFLKIRSRKSNIVYIRYAIAAILRKYTVSSLSEIGDYVGLHHSTVIYAEKQCNLAKSGFHSELLQNYKLFTDELKKMGVI